MEVHQQLIEKDLNYAISCPEHVKGFFREKYGKVIIQPSQKTLSGYIEVIKAGIEYDQKVKGSSATTGGIINIIIIKRKTVEKKVSK